MRRLSIVLLFAASASLSPGSTTALAALVVLLVLFVALAVVHFVPPQAAPYVRAATSASIGAWLFVVACDVFVQAGAMDLVRVLVFSNDDAQVDLMASTPSGKGLIAGWWLIAATSLAGQTLWIAKAGVLGGDEKVRSHLCPVHVTAIDEGVVRLGTTTSRRTSLRTQTNVARTRHTRPCRSASATFSRVRRRSSTNSIGLYDRGTMTTTRRTRKAQ